MDQITPPIVYFMIGIPGSGKSYATTYLFGTDPVTTIISLDEIRDEFPGGRADQTNNAEVMVIAKERITTELSAGRNVVYDATNTRRQYRQEMINVCRTAGARTIIGVWFRTPFELCESRNDHRSPPVESYVVRNAEK